MNFDGIILDIDGTIWNTTEIVADAWNNAIENNFPNVSRVNAEILKTQFGKTMKEIADNIFPELNDEQKQILMDECCKQEHIFLSNNKSNITYPGVVETIKDISSCNKIFIVSNCQKGYIEVVIKKNGLEHYITDFESYGNTKLGKADNIKLVMKRNGLSNPVYVGDTLGDFNACKECGIEFIWAKYGFGTINDKSYFGEIEKFSDLKRLI